MTWTAICGIYKITNRINGKFYIGSSVHIYNRWSMHKHHLINGTHENSHLQRAWNKYGEESFLFEIIEKCSRDIVKQKEQEYLDKYKSYDQSIGYNTEKIVGKGHLGRTFSPEHIENIRKANLGNKHHLGCKATAEQRARMSVSHLGISHPHTKEQNIKIGLANRGKKHTEEFKERCRWATIGQWYIKRANPN